MSNNSKKSTFNTLNTVTTAMLCAVAVILATTLHAFPVLAANGLAKLLAPMHFPILLVGILCGPVYGVIGGAITPVVSYLMGGAKMDPTSLVTMIVELAVYGLMTGLLRKVFLKNPTTNKFYSTLVLIIAMVVGRTIQALLKTFIIASEDAFIPTLWANFIHSFESTWGGIVAQLILIPALLYALLRGGILVKYIPDLPVRQKAKTEVEENQPQQETQSTQDTAAE